MGHETSMQILVLPARITDNLMSFLYFLLSGFDTFKEEVGISSRDSSMKRGLSLDVSYDEQDMIKVSNDRCLHLSFYGGLGCFHIIIACHFQSVLF